MEKDGWQRGGQDLFQNLGHLCRESATGACHGLSIASLSATVSSDSDRTRLLGLADKPGPAAELLLGPLSKLAALSVITEWLEPLKSRWAR